MTADRGDVKRPRGVRYPRGVVDQARASIRASSVQAVTFVELFFDLVFVFAVTQLTALTAHDLDRTGMPPLDPAGLADLVGVDAVHLDAQPGGHQPHPSSASSRSPRPRSPSSWPPRCRGRSPTRRCWFAVPYVVVRLLGLGLQVRVELERTRHEPYRGLRWASMSLIGLVLVLAGALVDPPAAPGSGCWPSSPTSSPRRIAGAGHDLGHNPAHMSERHGLFVIIALGESLIVRGGRRRRRPRCRPALILAVGASVVVACLLWWTYFGWLKDALEHRSTRPPIRAAEARSPETPSASPTSRSSAASSASPWRWRSRCSTWRSDDGAGPGRARRRGRRCSSAAPRCRSGCAVVAPCCRAWRSSP